MSIRYGCHADLAQAPAVRQAGFDFIEIPLLSTLQPALADDAWQAELPDTAGLPIEAGIGLLPPELPVIGPRRDEQALRAHMRTVTARAARLGVRTIGFGSAAARRRPEGVSHRQAEQDLVAFCRMAGDLCAAHDQILAVQNMHPGVTNTLNRPEEIRQLLERLDHPAVEAMLDLYHLALAEEPPESLLRLAGRIRHVHVAEPLARAQPGAAESPEQAYDHAEAFQFLRKAGFAGPISIEAKWTGPIDREGPAALQHLRDAWRQTEEA